MSTTDEMLKAVKKYTAKGWVVHPLAPPEDKGKSPGKRPLLPEWQKLEKTPEDIGKDVKDGGNIGLVCGNASGVIVIDFDHPLFWESALRDVELFTLSAHRTEGRGHTYFQYIPELKSQKHQVLGIEILGDGSNAVLPPSRHVSGDTYTWVNPDAPLAPMPQKLLERLRILFQTEANLIQQMNECRPCFKKLWNDGKPNALHGADGREAMLAWATELKAKGAGIDEILMLARLVYKNEFSSKDTTQEWKNIKTKPWTCRKIKERLSSIISCADCPIEKKRTGQEDARETRPIDLADGIMQQNRFLTFIETEEIFHYRDGAYEPFAEAEIKKQAQAVKRDVSTHWCTEIIANLKIRSYQSMKVLDQFTSYLHLENGILNLDTLQLEEYSPEKIVVTKLPLKYNPNAACPEITQFLTQVLSEQDLPAVEEFFGYCLLRDYPVQKAFMLVGAGSNGKSTLLALLKSFLGSENVASVSLQEIEENKFAVANLFGKLANVYADIPRAALATTGRIKMLTGGDVLTAEKKFGGFFSFVNHAKMIFSANQIPISYDESDAFFRRWVILNFPNTFDEQQGNGLLERLTAPEELSGLLNIAVKGLKRLLENRKFSNQKTTEEVREQYVRMSDSIQAFVWDCIEIAPEKFIPKKELYIAYAGYCRNKNIPISSEKTFFMRFSIMTRVEEFNASIDGKRVKSYKGVILKLDIDVVRDVRDVWVSESIDKTNKEQKKLDEISRNNAGVEIIGNPEQPEHPEQDRKNELGCNEPSLTEQVSSEMVEWQKINGIINSSNITAFVMSYFKPRHPETNADDVIAIAKKIARITPTPNEIRYLSMKILRAVPKFAGVDKKVYDGFKEGDVVMLPEINAKALIKKRAAEQIKEIYKIKGDV